MPTSLETVEEYMEAVFRRGREPMEPAHFEPNWNDQPSRHKTYLDVDRIRLTESSPENLPSAFDVLLAGGTAAGKRDQPWDLDAITFLLRNSYSPLNRRLRINWNQDSEVRELYSQSLWGRGAASGGGMYPLEIYLVTSGDFAALSPGIYHYSTAHNALERLLVGDVTATVRNALPNRETALAFLLVTSRFWKNSFKYNSFCYHVVTQDLGALMQVWRYLATSSGRPIHPRLLFDDRALNGLLGLDELDESVLGVVPLGEGASQGAPTDARIETSRFHERSHVTRRFETVSRVHEAVLDAPVIVPTDPTVVPTTTTDAPESVGVVSLPHAPDYPGDGTIPEVLRDRRSSFGAFSSTRTTTVEELSVILSAAERAGAETNESWDGAIPAPSVFVLANRIEGLPSGSWEHRADSGELWPIHLGPIAHALQLNYYLSNYNLQEAAAVLAIAGNWSAAREQHGARAYRLVNFSVAAVAQSVNVAATAIGVGSGIVLGFDNISIDEMLDLDGTPRRTFLFVIIGKERPDAAQFTSDIK